MKILFSLLTFILVLIIPNAFGEPVLFDRNFEVQEVASGLSQPVQLDFVGDDLLVLEKRGDVRLIRNGILHDEPVLRVEVSYLGHGGLLGITHVEDTVFLYMTQKSENPDEPLVNRIYKYKWNGDKLVEPVLVNEFSGNPQHMHVGGVMVADSDGNVYTVIGDLLRKGFLQHFEGGEPDDTGVVLRVGLDDSIIRPYLSENPFDHYYGIGIRSSFGLTIDPVSGYLWQTENGPENFDEINLIRSGFDGGWKTISGPSTPDQVENLKKIEGYEYRDPKFSWENTVAPTGLTFIDSEQFSKYHNTLLVTDFNTGSIFKFELNNKRDGFVFIGSGLKDLVANPSDSIQEIMFGTGFMAISDIKAGPDGLLYLSSFDNGGTIYRIDLNKHTSIEHSPKKLQESGVKIEEIECDEGFFLMIKKINEHAICLKPKSAIKLIERNWAVPLIKPLDFCNNPPSPGVNWAKCNFSFSDMSEINLKGANLFANNLVGSNFKNSNLENSNLSESNLAFINFTNANLSNSKIVKSKSFHSDYSNAILMDVDVSETNFAYSTFNKADFSGAKMSKAFFTYADLSNAKLTNVDMTQAKLADANLKKVDLTGSDLSKANLRKVDFSGANLKDVNFSDADLFGAKFFDTDLSGADFTNANLENAKFDDSILNKTKILID